MTAAEVAAREALGEIERGCIRSVGETVRRLKGENHGWTPAERAAVGQVAQDVIGSIVAGALKPETESER